ncbi:MAG: hypothetical protein K2X50_02350 [Gammaproteobacteria bacterium]|nr:hypothetical protein [Gammaproteobacteria bacterium]
MKIAEVDVNIGHGRMRPAALLDMDHTLAYTAYVKNDKGENETDETGEIKTEIKYNIDLLNKLKANGIRDVYLFTDMTLSKSSLEDRLKAIKFLEEMGFTVHGVITPLDFFWNFDSKILREFEEATYRAGVVLTAGRQKNIDLLQGIIKNFPEIMEHMDSNEYPNIGIAFKEATLPCNLSNPDKIRELQLRGNACKHAIDAMSLLKEIPTCKGIMFMQFISHLLTWMSAIYVFDDMKENNQAVNQCNSAKLPVYTVDGEFSQKTHTFPDNTTINAEEVSVEARLTYIAVDTLAAMESLKKVKTLGNIFYKTESEQALNLLTQIKVTEDSFQAIWSQYIAHFQKISKNFFGNYQPSALDKHLLQLISEDEIICKKIGIQRVIFMGHTSSRTKDEHYQKILERLLSSGPQDKKNLSTSSLHSSTAQIPKLPSLRSSGNIPLFASGKSKEKEPPTRVVRLRSFSDAQPHMDTISASAKQKATSEESVQLDSLPLNKRLDSQQQLKMLEVLGVIREDSESSSDSEPVIARTTNGSGGF